MKNTIKVVVTNQDNPSETLAIVIRGEETFDEVVDRVLDDEPKQTDFLGDNLLNTDANFLVHVNDSSFVDILEYNFYTQVLTVHLDSGTYEYKGVTAGTFLAFVNADSKGRFYNTHFRNRRH